MIFFRQLGTRIPWTATTVASTSKFSGKGAKIEISWKYVREMNNRSFQSTLQAKTFFCFIRKEMNYEIDRIIQPCLLSNRYHGASKSDRRVILQLRVVIIDNFTSHRGYFCWADARNERYIHFSSSIVWILRQWLTLRECVAKDHKHIMHRDKSQHIGNLFTRAIYKKCVSVKQNWSRIVSLSLSLLIIFDFDK